MGDIFEGEGAGEQFLEKDPVTGEKIIYVCHGKSCGRSCRFLVDRLEQVRAKGYQVKAEVTTCMARCEEGPNIRVKDQIYTKMNPIKISELAKKIAHRKV